jgi:hypothetical protein
VELERHVVSLSFFPSLPEWTILSVGLSQSRTPSSGSFFRSSSPWRLSPVLVDGTLLWETTAAYLPSCTAFSSVPERLRCEVRQRERERERERERKREREREREQ